MTPKQFDAMIKAEQYKRQKDGEKRRKKAKLARKARRNGR